MQGTRPEGLLVKQHLLLLGARTVLRNGAATQMAFTIARNPRALPLTWQLLHVAALCFHAGLLMGMFPAARVTCRGFCFYCSVTLHWAEHFTALAVTCMALMLHTVKQAWNSEAS